MLSYAKWDDYEIRMPTYLDGHKDYDRFDIVKWEDTEPYEAIDWITGEKKTYTNHCYTIAMLEWDNKYSGFEFRSCGVRYLDERKDGLEKFIKEFVKAEYYKRTGEKWDD